MNNGYIVKGNVIFNRHLKIKDVFINNSLSNFFHNLPPSLLKYILILYINKKYNLDSFETGGMKIVETYVWKYYHKIDAVIDGDYLILKNSDNISIDSITKNKFLT